MDPFEFCFELLIRLGRIKTNKTPNCLIAPFTETFVICITIYFSVDVRQFRAVFLFLPEMHRNGKRKSNCKNWAIESRLVFVRPQQVRVSADMQ